MKQFHTSGIGLFCALILILSASFSCKKEVSGTTKSKRSGAGASADDDVKKSDDDAKKSEDMEKIQRRQDELEKKIEDEIAARMKEDANLRVDLDEVKSRLNALEKKLNDEIQRLDNKDKLLADEIAALKAKGKEVDDFIASANVNFVTKTQLQNVVNTVTELEQSIAILRGDVVKLDEKVDQETAQIRNQMSVQIRLLKIDVAKSKDEAFAAIKNVQAQHLQLIKALYLQLVMTQQEVYRLGTKVDHQLPVILANLSVRVANLESFSSQMQIDFNQKINELKQADASLSQDVKDARTEVIQALNEHIAEENRQKSVINAKIQELQIELERVAAIATQTAALVEANARDTQKLRVDFEAAKAQFQKELDAMRDDFGKKLAEVKLLATNVTVNLGISIQQQFILLNGNMADFEQRTKLIVNLITQIFVPVVVQVNQRAHLEEVLLAPTDSAAMELDALTRAARRVETAFIDAIDPILSRKGVDTTTLGKNFRTLQEICVKEQGFNDPTPSLRSREWFFHMARTFIYDATFGVRAGGTDDKVFFGQAVNWIAASLPTLVVSGLTLPYGADSEKNCYAAVQSWARDNLFGPTPMAINVRDALAASPDLGKELQAYFEALNKAIGALASWEQTLKQELQPSLGSALAVETFLSNANQYGVTPRSRVANQILDRVKFGQATEELRVERERIFELARKTNANEADIAKLKMAVAELAQSTNTSLAKLTESQKQALQLIAAIAGRLGYDDLAQKAADELTNLGGTVDPSLQNLPAQCIAAQHFYNHATDKTLPVMRCESRMSVGDQPVSGNAMTRCAIHGAFMQGNQLLAYTWGNRSESGNGWDLQGEVSGGQRVDNGLLLKHYDPTDQKARELSLRSPGSAYPQDGESIFMLRILGAAAKFKIDVKSVTNPEFEPYSVTVDAAPFQVAGGNNKLVYEVPVPKAIQRLGACRWDREVTITAYDKSGAPSSQRCLHRFHTFSPLVLDFAWRDRPDLVNPVGSSVRFDLDADGRPDQTGWISGKSALLAFDRNQNGRIDNGSELFGEATPMAGGKFAANGYEALATLDTDRNGIIDQRDANFANLLVWFDVNQDGVSQPHELKTLAAAGVTQVAVDFEELAEVRQLDRDDRPEANLIKYQARFYGPKSCGPLGCRSYDVYFGSSSSWTVAAQPL